MEELLERKVNYHDKCYLSFAKVHKFDRARKRSAESINIGESSVVKRKKGRSSLAGETTDNDYELLFFIRLNTVTHVVLYHNLCWAKAKRLAEPEPKPVENYAKTLADIELLNIIETNIHQNPNNTLYMNFINETHINNLIENGADPKEVSNNYKKELKKLLSVNFPDLLFVKSTQKNKPEQLIYPSTQASVFNPHLDSIADESDIRSLWKLAKKIRLEVLEQKWEFQGKFTNYKMPALLSTFMK